MSKTNFTLHTFFLFCLFVCGNAVITLPFYRVNNPFLCIFISAVLSLVFLLFCATVIKRILRYRAVFLCVSPVLILLAVYGVIITLYNYLQFLSKVQLPQTNTAVLTATLVLVVLFVALSPTTALYKYCLLSGVILVTMIVFMFFSGLKHFDLSQIARLTPLSSGTLKIFLQYFTSLSIPLTFMFLTDKKGFTKATALGVIAGFLAITACLAQSIFTLGAYTDRPFPYIDAVGVISSGSLFTRYDGLVYFVYFVTATVKAEICLKTIFLIVKAYKNPPDMA